ncbi:Uncharacterised protein [uncultured archaeon]|nr:Uncharacterised protein [uncultured archaeon]
MQLETYWHELEECYTGGELVYRRLDLEHETGIRMAVLRPGKTWAILIEILPEDASALMPPRWRGMGFKIISLIGPDLSAKHICLYIENSAHRSVFRALVSDIIRTLESRDLTLRIKNLQNCFNRWSRFFERWGPEGVSAERQRGLFGELMVLETLLRTGLSPLDGVSSWKGSSGANQDFVHLGAAIEVKTTITKEPRKVSVSSEKQLDDTDLESLTLVVLTLNEVESGGISLPDAVATVRQLLENDGKAGSIFESSLIAAGYLDTDADKYSKHYTIRSREIFDIRSGFPRIVSVPRGVGDLHYTVTISACKPFEKTVGEMIKEFTGIGSK